MDKVFRKKMEKELYKKLTTGDLSARPKNCEGLSQVITNPILWGNLSEATKNNDKKLQSCQKALVRASSILSRMFNNLVLLKGSKEKIEPLELLKMVNDSLSLLGDLNFNLNMFRRQLMKPDLKDSYKKLNPVTRLYADRK